MSIVRTFFLLGCGAAFAFVLFGVVMFSSAFSAGAVVTMSFAPPPSLAAESAFVLFSAVLAGWFCGMAHKMANENP
jgi:hypothetical protein